jgi:hypothetical protein
MVYRTRTHIAGDWTGDANLINQLQKWNEADYWGLSFSDAHKMTQARDTSLPCSIKRSLKERLDGSKTFVLIVGSDTKTLTKGACRYCSYYSSYSGCVKGHSIDYRSFINYECDYAARYGLKTIVLYNSSCINKSKCPDSVRDIADVHIPAYYYTQDGYAHWNYQQIKNAISG